MYKLPPEFVGRYAEQDAGMTLRLWERLKIETRKARPLEHLEPRDRSDPYDVRHASAWCARRCGQGRQGQEVSKVQGPRIALRDPPPRLALRIEPWAAASVAAVFEELGLKYPKTEAGAPSFTKQYLSAHEHPVAQMIVKLREFDKADSTFIDTILKHEHNGRIHCEFHQLRSDDGGTVTGRFSSSNPNLQQIPARDPEIKKLIRGLFIPKRAPSGGRLTTQAKSQGYWFTLQLA